MIPVVGAGVAAKWFVEKDRLGLFRRRDAREIGARQARLALDAPFPA